MHTCVHIPCCDMSRSENSLQQLVSPRHRTTRWVLGIEHKPSCLAWPQVLYLRSHLSCSLPYLLLSFLRQGLSLNLEPGGQQTPGSPHLYLPSTGVTVRHPYPTFYVGVRDPSSGPHAFTAPHRLSRLLPPPRPDTHFVFFFFFKEMLLWKYKVRSRDWKSRRRACIHSKAMSMYTFQRWPQGLSLVS